MMRMLDQGRKDVRPLLHRDVLLQGDVILQSHEQSASML